MHLLTAMIQQRLKSPLARKVVVVVIHKVAAANPDSVALLKAQASGGARSVQPDMAAASGSSPCL